jgi:hypothetical protein
MDRRWQSPVSWPPKRRSGVLPEISGQDWGNDGRYKKKECIQRFVSPLLRRLSPAVTPKPIMHKHITLTIL